MKRKLLIGFMVAIAALFGYANLRHVNPSAYLEPVDVGTFEISNPSGVDLTGYSSYVAANPAIRACSINPEKSVAGITYKYKVMNEEALVKYLGYNGALQVHKKVFDVSDKPQCPVHGVLAMWHRVLDVMRIV